ncbi:MAG TPA: peptidase T [Mesotoga sp.]|nr:MULTISPECIES: peptidase T [Mesotoga]MCB1222578.1 peptidase T [Mesotoga sp.]HNQ70664.1 peptidase T [Mesotoga prima]HNS75715.1 peptidase T [Mesotoga prima]HOP37470.1 peptidase T [Mesotoga prima]HOZ99696.1 peptidase T [Mesotoga prima]
MIEKLIERFLRYISIETTSSFESKTFPSTTGQLVLARTLKEDMESMGLSEVTIDDFGYVMGTLPSNLERKLPVIGFISHMDTSPEMSGKDVRPSIVKYQGGKLLLNKKDNLYIDPQLYPEIERYVGEDLIVTDGTTLLGADDKAGIAEILTAMEFIISNPRIKHGKIRVAFTPDEEIGRGTKHFSIEEFGADYAYTVDGGGIGELQYETFNAANTEVVIKGLNIHPGSAKDRMKNSMLIACEFNAMLPSNEIPATTCGREGFFHLISVQGSVEETILKYIIRDHSREKFSRKKMMISEVAALLNFKYGEDTVTFCTEDSYYNMKEKIEEVYFVVETAKRAMESLSIEPKIEPVRGGTDGARLSFMGLPTPNLFTGGHNFHGRFEYIPIRSMEKSVQVITKIVELFSEEATFES